jgi:hypothetical protein
MFCFLDGLKPEELFTHLFLSYECSTSDDQKHESTFRLTKRVMKMENIAMLSDIEAAKKRGSYKKKVTGE